MFEHVRTKRVLTALTTVALVGALLGAGIYVSSQPSLAADIAIDDVSFSSNDGAPSSVTITPYITASWSGLDEDATEVRVSVDVSDDGSDWKKITFSRTTSLTPSKAGSHHFELETDDVTDVDDYRPSVDTPAFTLADFAAADGTTKDTTVFLRIWVTVYLEDGDTVSETYERSFVVSVENRPATAHGSGTVDTAASD